MAEEGRMKRKKKKKERKGGGRKEEWRKRRRWKEKKKEKLYEYPQEFAPVLRLSVLASHCAQLYS